MSPSRVPPPGGDVPSVVAPDAGDVAFIDAPGLDADAVFSAVDDLLSGMTAGAIVTVYTDDPEAVAEAPTRCAHRDLTLLATIAHDERDGRTLAVRRRTPPAASATEAPAGDGDPTKPPQLPRLPPKT